MARTTGERRQLPLLKPGDLASIPGIFGMDEALASDTLWEPHSHATDELLWNERGMSMAIIEARAWAISPDVGLWIPAGTVHTGHAPSGTWYRAEHFDPSVFPPLARHPVAVQITPLLKLLIARLHADVMDPEARQRTEHVLRDILTPAPDALSVRIPQSPLLEPIVTAILKNPGDRRTLSQWAQLRGVNARTITRAFQTETTLGFSDWVAAVRAQAALLLLGSGLSADEVASQLGYASVSAFGSAFRRTTGVTPGKVRTHANSTVP